jgi:HPt (histidine-containing phosphotransfer) domain-containing protein
MARERERSVDSGMNVFLPKPFKAAQLEDILQPIAAAKGAAAPMQTAPAAAEPLAAAATRPATAPEPPPAAEPPPEELSGTQVAELLESPAPAPSPAQRLPVLDLEQVAAIRGLGKPQVFERLCEMLFASSKEAFERLDTALSAADLEEVAAAAHALKSPVSNLGGRRLADLLERCEVAAREGSDITAVRRSAAGLKAHYAALVAALEAETRRGTGTV